jgi:multidrug efflux pump subunit AcrA (membrane-fusion protein)
MVPVLLALVVGSGLAGCDRTSESDEQIAELEQQVADLEIQLEQSQTEAEIANAQLGEAEQQLADTQAELSDTQAELTATQEELGTTQAELLDAQAQLAKVGEVVLEDGTYVGQVLGAKASPYRVIIFDAGGLYRVAQVSKEPTITAGGDDYTLSQFGKLLSSTNPDDAKLANGNYQVIVRNGLVTSIRKSQA